MTHWTWKQSKGRTEDGGGRSGYAKCCDGCQCGHDCVKLYPGTVMEHEYYYEKVERLAREKLARLAPDGGVPTG